jgi:hypothetical protein
VSGSLTGVGATFNGEVSIPNGLFSINGDAISGPPTGGVGIRHVNNRLLIYGGTTDITFQKNSNTGPNLTILESGAATFTNTITANTSITVNKSGAQAAILSAVSAFADGYRATLRLWNQHTGGKAWEVYSTNNSDGAYSGGKMVFVNSTDSVTTMTLTSGGSVGIGTSSPSSTFHVRGTFGAPSTTGSSLNGVARFGQTSGNGGLDIGFGDPYSWLQSRNATDYSVNYNLVLQPNGGLVGVGTTDVDAQFKIFSNSAINLMLATVSKSSVNIVAQKQGVGYSTLIIDAEKTQIYSSNSEKFRIDTNGVVKIGNGVSPDDGRSPGYANISMAFVTSVNEGSIQAVQQGINVYTLRLNASGGAVYAGSVRLDTLSDERMKKDITSLENTLEIIKQLNPKKFYLIDEKNAKLRYGFIAQELEGILDNFVYDSDMKYKDEETGYEVENIKGIENWASSWAALLVKGMQEQQSQIQELKAEFEEYKATHP